MVNSHFLFPFFFLFFPLPTLSNVSIQKVSLLLLFSLSLINTTPAIFLHLIVRIKLVLNLYTGSVYQIFLFEYDFIISSWILGKEGANVKKEWYLTSTK